MSNQKPQKTISEHELAAWWRDDPPFCCIEILNGKLIVATVGPELTTQELGVLEAEFDLLELLKGFPDTYGDTKENSAALRQLARAIEEIATDIDREAKHSAAIIEFPKCNPNPRY